ncbi:hypothetical protein LTR35_008969 [Friedmanniomyces endolithicus]|uniref:Uncharacterized protein n=1 Tax=Friedmanniomyces endolithicus TaxID=329885 RepID=A0AAN6G3I8_9PEZI|nr:hypothetical protein LTR35_008969 [Friedmanniomyces endolithicus]KAK0327131.1 hypothetical protein LTR82_001893 [Friedmanniomyces endolithicus]KAK1016474.1 hypothetical protein LTR54_003152 [Friedmanniomyces endolithicus]
MVCKRVTDVLEDGLNVWYEPADPRIHIVLIHGLSSNPYWAWHFGSVSPSESNTGSGLRSFVDSAVSSLPNLSNLSRRQSRWELTSEGSPPAVESLAQFGTFWPRDLLPVDIPDARISTLGYRSQWNSSKFETSFLECGDHLLELLEVDRRSNHCLKAGNQQVCTLQDDFRRLCPELPAVCFYEKLKSARWKVLVVKEQSAKLFGAPSSPMFRDHQGMIKYSSGNDEAYLQVLDAIRKMRKDVRHRKPNPTFAAPQNFDIVGTAIRYRVASSGRQRPSFDLERPSRTTLTREPPRLAVRMSMDQWKGTDHSAHTLTGVGRAREWLQAQRPIGQLARPAQERRIPRKPLTASTSSTSMGSTAESGREESRAREYDPSREFPRAEEHYPAINEAATSIGRPRHLSAYLQRSYDILEARMRSAEHGVHSGTTATEQTAQHHVSAVSAQSLADGQAFASFGSERVYAGFAEEAASPFGFPGPPIALLHEAGVPKADFPPNRAVKSPSPLPPPRRRGAT